MLDWGLDPLSGAAWYIQDGDSPIAWREVHACFQPFSQHEEKKMADNSITLDQLAPGQSARVQKVNGAGAIRRRLLDMGITGGAEITVVKASPLGDPVEYLVRGYHLSLRKAEAQMIAVVREP
jgi:ferrous iron transport protein A